LLLAVALFAVSANGYGMVIRYGWMVWLFFVVFVVGLPSFRWGGVSAVLPNVALVVAVGVAGLLAGDGARRAYCRSKCRACDPVLERLSAYRATHGVFPTNLPPSDLPRGITIQQRGFTNGGLNLVGINEFDATLYLGTNGYLCVVPVTKMLPMSFSRFYAYGRNETDREWRYDYFVWFLGVVE
jgi:hypothetical protein